MTDWKAKLKALGPCPEAYRWAIKHKTLREAWRMCERTDWMRWMVTQCEGGWGCKMYLTLLRVGDLARPRGDTRPNAYEEYDLQNTYMYLDFMPDPPRLPEIQ